MIDDRIMAAPFPPNSQFILGTDPGRHDLLSRIIHGAGSTLSIALSVVALRLIIGCGLGWLVAWARGSWGRLAAHLTTASATIPTLLFAWVFIVAVGPGAGFTVFVLGLGLTGWAHWTQLLEDELRQIRLQPYMEAAEAVGVPARRQLSRYVLPNLLPVALPILAQEVAAALLLLAELGFLGVFYGNGQVISPQNLDQGTFYLEFHDWAGMLAGTRLEVFRHWWLPVAPAGAFFIAIVGFHLLGDGLRAVLEPTDQRARPVLFRALTAIWARARVRRPVGARTMST
jgi:peptide/nickel transport system permease protein